MLTSTGNVLVLEDGRVGFIDFGIVGKIPSTTWNALNDIISCFALNDWSGVALALVALGATDDRINVDVNKFGKDLEDVVASIMELTPNIDIIADAQGTSVAATLSIEERDITRVVLEIVKVADNVESCASSSSHQAGAIL